MIQTTQEREAGRSYSLGCRWSTEVICMRCFKHDCTSLPQSSPQTVRQISVSLITPKSRWYRPWCIIPTYRLFACIDNRLLRHLQVPNRPVQLRQTTHRKQLLHPSSRIVVDIQDCYWGVDKEKNRQEGHSRHTPIACSWIIDYLDR
jgi:hypothetical protein